jgi:hypothetical protein
MKRTKQNKRDISQELALELFSSDAYLTLNKKLLKKFGPEKAVFLSNLIDKFKYFKSRGMLEDDWSFLDRERELEDTGLTNYAIRKCKKELVENGILSIQKRGIPARIWTKIHFNVLLEVTNSLGQEVTNSLGLYNKELKYNKNKNNNIPEDEKQEKTPPLHFRLAEQLSNIIQSNKNIRHTPAQVRAWALEISYLVSRSGVSIERVENALSWYSEHIGEKYVPVIESGRSLREKFIKLEDAIKREKDNRQVIQKPPDEIMRSYFGGGWKEWNEYCFAPALDLMSDTAFATQQHLADQLCLIDIWYDKKQNIPNLKGREDEEIYSRWRMVPDSFQLVEKFVQWLKEQRWVGTIYLAHLHPEGAVFQQFLDQYQKELGLNFFDGSYL